VNSREAFHSCGVQTHSADLLDPRGLDSLPDLGTVFFLAGMKFGTSDSPETLRRYNEEMPDLVARRFRSSSIVALSTGCVYPFAPVESPGCTEEVEPAPPGDYAKSCLGRETAFARVSRENGTPTALIRLNYAVEFRYGVLTDIALKVLHGEPVDLSTGRVNVIWQRDAVEHILCSTRIAASPAVPLNITGAPPISVRDIAHRFGTLFGREASFSGQEESTAWLNDASRSHRLFGPPPTGLDDMISWIAAWLLAGGATHGKPTKFENREGKF
jgi:nucleoside-diphosphate-sugar epimerase